LLLSLVTSLGLAAWWVVAHPSRRGAAPGPPAVKPVVPDHGPEPAVVAENFCHAASQAERLKWVRQAADVGAAMAGFFSDGAGAHETVSKLAPILAGEQEPDLSTRFAVTLDGGGRRLLCVVRENGEAKVDFKAYARHGSATWDDLLDGKVTKAREVRVSIQKDDYYNYGFSHEESWQNFKATSPDLESSLYFYLVKSHPSAKALEQLSSKNPVRVTLSIRALGDSQRKRQFEITKVLGIGWVLGD